MFVYQWKMIKLFLWIFKKFMGIFRLLFNKFFWPRTLPARLWRSNGPVDRTQSRSTDRSTDVHRSVHVGWHLGRSTGRSTGPESSALCFWAVDRLPPTVKNMTVGGRPAGRPPAVLADSNSQTASFWRRLFKPHFLGTLTRFSRGKICLFSGV